MPRGKQCLHLCCQRPNLITYSENVLSFSTGGNTDGQHSFIKRSETGLGNTTDSRLPCLVLPYLSLTEKRFQVWREEDVLWGCESVIHSDSTRTRAESVSHILALDELMSVYPHCQDSEVWLWNLPTGKKHRERDSNELAEENCSDSYKFYEQAIYFKHSGSVRIIGQRIHQYATTAKISSIFSCLRFTKRQVVRV